MRAIPIYALYGETADHPKQDWLHWETIQSRSRLHDYRIAPHRHEQFFQVLRLTHGTARVSLDEVSFELEAPAVVAVPALTVHGYEFSHDVDGIVVTLMERDLRELEAPLPPASVLSVEAPEVTAALERLIAEADRPGPAHHVAMRAHLALLLVAFTRARVSPKGEAGGDRARQRVQQFRRLVDTRFRETRRIADYAGVVGISPTHLNRLCRQVLGHSALMVIERRMALEARRMLQFSTLAIKEIGADLGYDDPAYFSRVLTRVLGQAPGRYRAAARAGELPRSDHGPAGPALS